jgi:predicted ribosome quality control (RQC) complex YloA/Tae2 family protein
MRAGLSSSESSREEQTAHLIDDLRAERTLLLEVGLARARARVTRRIRALQGDLERIVGAEALSHRAQLFVVAATRAPRGTSRLVAPDWSSGEAAEATMEIDPALSPKEQIDAIFRRSRRLKSGAPIAERRLRDAHEALSKLEALRAALAADGDADVDALAAEARAAAPRDFVPPPQRAPKQGANAEAGLPYRVFLGASARPIWVGRGAAFNDSLTLHVAKPHHLWLHARGHAGAHVVVPLEKGTTCPGDLLVEAAHLAAHFSKARDEGTVEITYVARRHVRKPRGSPPGLVVVAREKTLVLRRSEDVVRRLLDRELAV